MSPFAGKISIFMIFLISISCTYAEDDKIKDVELVPTTDKTPKVSSTELNAENCMKRRIGCCSTMYIGTEEELMKCFTLHQSKLPKEMEKDLPGVFKFFSCFVECQYKGKKYLGKGDNINIKMVKKDAEKTYANRPKERDYHIAMFEFCSKDALTLYNMIKMNPGGRVLLKDNCKPYFMFVFLCIADYHEKISARCPYFKWEGKRKTEAEEECMVSKEKCYEIDGIKL